MAQAATHQAATDEVVDKLERRAREHTKKPQRRHRPLEEKNLLRSIADGTPDTTAVRPAVVKTKRFAIEPMFEEDAVARMEELGHAFFVFVNAENERVAVLYRRRDGDYGLIEPTMGGGYSTNGRRALGSRPGRQRDRRTRPMRPVIRRAATPLWAAAGRRRPRGACSATRRGSDAARRRPDDGRRGAG